MHAFERVATIMIFYFLDAHAREWFKFASEGENQCQTLAVRTVQKEKKKHRTPTIHQLAQSFLYPEESTRPVKCARYYLSIHTLLELRK
jgi:hypothetical protein